MAVLDLAEGRRGDRAVTAERRILGLVVVGLLLILTVSLTFWFLSNFERRIERIPIGYSAEARRNDLLAAERLLHRLGVPVESRTGRDRLRALPPAADTLVVLGLGPMSDARRAALLDWMQSGGHLVVEAMESWDADRPAEDLLSELGIRLRVASPQSETALTTGEVLAEIPVQGRQRPATAGFNADYYLETTEPADAGIRADGRLRVIRRPIGAGRLTVLSDSELMANTDIGHHDHAYTTLWLIDPRPAGKVWLLHDTRMPGLGALLWSAAPYALVSALVLLLAWLWSLGGQLGPLGSVADRRRRDLIEHLQASGDFLWRHGAIAELAQRNRRRILAGWMSRHPQLPGSDARALTRGLAAATGRSGEEVTRLLLTQPAGTHGLVEQAALLHALWRGAGKARRAGLRPPERSRTDARRSSAPEHQETGYQPTGEE